MYSSPCISCIMLRTLQSLWFSRLPISNVDVPFTSFYNPFRAFPTGDGDTKIQIKTINMRPKTTDSHMRVDAVNAVASASVRDKLGCLRHFGEAPFGIDYLKTFSGLMYLCLSVV